MHEAYADMARRGAVAYARWVLFAADEEIGCPAEWAGAFRRLALAEPHASFTPESWDVLVCDASTLATTWLPKIISNGWTVADVRGLLPLICGREIVGIGMADVSLRNAQGEAEKVFRRPNLTGACRWDVGRRAA